MAKTEIRVLASAALLAAALVSHAATEGAKPEPLRVLLMTAKQPNDVQSKVLKATSPADAEKLAKAAQCDFLLQNGTVYITSGDVFDADRLAAMCDLVDVLLGSLKDNGAAVSFDKMKPETAAAIRQLVGACGFASAKQSSSSVLVVPGLMLTLTNGGKSRHYSLDPSPTFKDKSAVWPERSSDEKHTGLPDRMPFELAAAETSVTVSYSKLGWKLDLREKCAAKAYEMAAERARKRIGELSGKGSLAMSQLRDMYADTFGHDHLHEGQGVADLPQRVQDDLVKSFAENYSAYGFSSSDDARSFVMGAKFSGIDQHLSFAFQVGGSNGKIKSEGTIGFYHLP